MGIPLFCRAKSQVWEKYVRKFGKNMSTSLGILLTSDEKPSKVTV